MAKAIELRIRLIPEVVAPVQLLEFELPDGVIEPHELMYARLPEEFDPAAGVVISGRGPVWLFCYLAHLAHHARWVATYDPRLPGAVVVQSHCREFRPGDVIPLKI